MKISDLTTRQKIFSVLIAVVAIGAIILGAISYANAQEDKRNEKLITFVDYRATRISGDILEEAKDLFDSGKKGYLLKDLTIEQIDAVQKKLDDASSSLPESNKKIASQLDQLKKNQQEVQGWLDLAKKHFAQQEQVNSLFQDDLEGRPTINGTEVAQDPIVKDEATADMIAKVGAIERTVINDYNDVNWAKDMESLVANANEQVTQITTARTAVELVYKDDQVVENPTEENYQQAQAEVDKIKNENVRNALNAVLDQVRAVLDTGLPAETDEVTDPEEPEEPAPLPEETPVQDNVPIYEDYPNNNPVNDYVDNGVVETPETPTVPSTPSEPEIPADSGTSSEPEPPSEPEAPAE